MNTALLTVMILAAQSPQFYYDALRQTRNPFAPTSAIIVVQEVQPVEEPQDEEPVIKPIDPDVIVKLDRLKAIVKTKSNKSLLYLGDEIVDVSGSFFGIPVVEVTLEHIILQNDHHVIKKIIGKPVEVIPISEYEPDAPPFYGEEQDY